MTFWYVSFHGGSANTDCNNIHVYTIDGRERGKALNRQSLPAPLSLRELRGFTFGPDGDLYVLNAYYPFSQVLRFNGLANQNGQHNFKEVFVAPDNETNPGLSHPFNLLFNPEGHLLVSSQNTNVVTRYFGSNNPAGAAGTPMPPSGASGPPAIPGCLVLSSKQTPEGIRSVRDIVFNTDGSLYVADRDDRSVKQYDGNTGTYMGKIDLINAGKPVHLLLHAGRHLLLIGDETNECVWEHNFTSGSTRVLIESGAGGLKNPSGLAFGNDDLLYVASRTERKILRFDRQGQPADPDAFIANLPDEPEFLQLVTLADSNSQ